MGLPRKGLRLPSVTVFFVGAIDANDVGQMKVVFRELHQEVALTGGAPLPGLKWKWENQGWHRGETHVLLVDSSDFAWYSPMFHW